MRVCRLEQPAVCGTVCYVHVRAATTDATADAAATDATTGVTLSRRSVSIFPSLTSSILMLYDTFVAPRSFD